jgi:GH43 family beta-xylosidase
VFAPGHNGSFKSPDSTEDWIVFHAKAKREYGWAGRLAHAQRFTWNADGNPNFGHPIPPGVSLNAPSGEDGAATAATIAKPDGNGAVR